MAGRYEDAARAAEAMARKAYSPGEREAYEKVAALWRRLGADAPEKPASIA